MPLFGRKSPQDRQREDAARAEMEASIASLQAGGIPIPAQRRLDEVRKGGKLFTSDLSVNEFLLSRQAGIEPVSQVMGSSVYHVGWQSMNAWNWGGSGELQVVSGAINEARALALSRLTEEAARAGGNVVLGVHLDQRYLDQNLIEFAAVGTAARVRRAPDTPTVGLTNLSGQDFWALYRAGYWPLGVVAGSTVYHAVPSWFGQMSMMGWGSWYNQELTDFTRGLYSARHLAMGRLQAAAQHLRAQGVVGVSITQSQQEYEIETGGGHRTDMIFTFHVIGTAIAALEREESLPPVHGVVNLHT